MSAKSQGLYKSVDTLWVKHNQLDARLAALEGKGGEARMATPEEIRQHDVGVVWEHIDALKEENAELERRLTEATAPTKRQQAAERFLEAWVGTATYVDAMYALRAMADFLDARDGVNIQRLLDMARVLEQAAREEQDA